jgi:hypothetical protein
VSQIADRHNADALTVGDEVILATGQDERSPSTLGVLAHELTHAARAREPRFVPPIAHEPMTSDEESVSLGVERAVRQSAQREQTAAHSTELPRTTTAAQTRPPAARAPSNRATALPSEAMFDDTGPSPWGGLPAPWEPLPDVVTQMLTQPGDGAATAATSGSFAPSSPAAASAPAATPAVQAAARDRSNDEPASGAAATTATSNGKGSSPAPDVDALARQVYDVLKRRLAAERRRGA